MELGDSRGPSERLSSFLRKPLVIKALSGKYYFRHLSLGTDGVNPGSLTDPRTLTGSITFDGSGHYAYIGQLLTGINAAVPQTGSGAYSLDAGGFLSLDSPLRPGAQDQRALRCRGDRRIEHRIHRQQPTICSSPFRRPPAGRFSADLISCMSLEFPGGATANMRSTQFSLSQLALGNLQAFSVFGHAAGISQGRPLTQQMTGGTYTMGADGVGSITVGAASNAQLLSGSRTLYLSTSGNIVLGGSTAAGGHDILIGVKAVSGASNATWNCHLLGRWTCASISTP